MSNENAGCVYAYGWNRINLRVIGIWPEREESWITRNLVWGWIFVLMITAWLPQAASIAFLWGNMDEVITILMAIIPITTAIMKLIIFRIRRNVLISILDLMIRDWSAPKTDDERKIMLKMAKIGKFVSIISVLLTCSMLLTYPSFKILLAMQEHESDANETVVDFLYISYFPCDTRPIHRFLPIWIGQIVALAVGLIAYSGPDSCVAMMILHLCGQLATVKIALINIVDEESVQIPSVYWKKLSTIVGRHEELNRYGKLIEVAFNGMLLIQMILYTVTFCVQGFFALTGFIDGVSTDEKYTIVKMAFVVVQGIFIIFHLFFHCWVGDLLVVNSTAISQAPYESDWYRLPTSQARALMMVTYRSRIPLQMTAGKFVGISLELFSSIFLTQFYPPWQDDGSYAFGVD